MGAINFILFGIASLVIASCGVIMWLAGLHIGPYIFFVFIIVGITLCFKGLFMNNKNDYQ